MRIWVSDGDRRLREDSGYGKVSASVSRGLIELGHEVQFQQFPGVELVLYICPPERIKFGRSMTSAAITMFELDYLPKHKHDWLHTLNRLDLVFVPTEWNREVWQREGLTTQVEVIPLGADPELYYPVTGRCCTFLCVHEGLGGDLTLENWDETLRAYYSAFTVDDDVRLLIKTWQWEPEWFEVARSETLDALGIDASMAPTVEVIDETLSTEGMCDLYQRAWVFVRNASHERSGMPCMEAVACGTSVVATRIQPLLSYLPEQTMWFEPGDIPGLADMLKREYLRFVSDLRRCHRNDAAATAKLVEVELERLLAERQAG